MLNPQALNVVQNFFGIVDTHTANGFSLEKLMALTKLVAIIKNDLNDPIGADLMEKYYTGLGNPEININEISELRNSVIHHFYVEPLL
ncbi:hypothetical protein [Bacillus subtilis]|uniref:hypothetical protein n=1 Tax=Bacillus subtilis TaxID=1423 RepID=UPI001BA1D0A3|nr:hypothetical protein [Bacillus subtilis]CAI6330931.1 hypothetical protein NRS6096_22220 [Bacillus subtilis]